MTVELEAAACGVTQSERWDIEDVAARAGVDAPTLVRAYAALRDVWRAHDDVADELRGKLGDVALARDEQTERITFLEGQCAMIERKLVKIRAVFDDEEYAE